MNESSVALVAGSSRGIGHEVARQLASRGYRVIVTSRDSRAVNRAAAKIGPSAVAHPLDTSDPSSIEAIARFVESEIGSLDVLVNNAAILLDEGKSIVDTTADDFEQTWRTNTLGPFLMTKLFAPLLRKSRHGRVVNVSSGAGQLSSMSSKRRTGRMDRCDRVVRHGFRLRLLPNFLAAQEIDASIVCDPEQPGRQGTLIVERIELPIRLEQRVLNDILSVQHRAVMREQ